MKDLVKQAQKNASKIESAKANVVKQQNKAQALEAVNVLARYHSSFSSLCRTIVEVCEGIEYTKAVTDEERTKVRTQVQALIGSGEAITKRKVWEALVNYSTYLLVDGNKEQILKRTHKAKGVYTFEAIESYTFSIVKEALFNKHTGKAQVTFNTEALGWYFDSKGNRIKEEDAKAMIEAQAKAKEVAKADLEQMKEDARKYREAQAKEREEAKAEVVARRENQRKNRGK
jgi:hypothetical protein